MPRHFVAAAIGHNPDRAVRQIPEQGRVLFLHVEDHRDIVRRVDAVHERVHRRLGAANLALQQRVESPLHIARGERTPIVKRDATMQMKDVGERIGNLPAFRQSGSHIQIVSARQQIVEDQVVNSFRLRVDPYPRIKIRWARVDDHDQRVGIGLGGEQEKSRERAVNDTEQSAPPSRCPGPTHTRSFPAPPPASRPWRTAHSKAAGSTSRKPAPRTPPPLSLPKASRTRRRIAARIPSGARSSASMPTSVAFLAPPPERIISRKEVFVDRARLFASRIAAPHRRSTAPSERWPLRPHLPCGRGRKPARTRAQTLAQIPRVPRSSEALRERTCAADLLQNRLQHLS